MTNTSEMNESLVNQTDYNELKLRYVRIDFLNLYHIVNFNEDQDILLEYLQNLSNYALNNEIMTFIKTSNKFTVLVKCVTDVVAQEFLEKLKSFQTECSFVVSLDEPPLKFQVNEFSETIKTSSEEILLEKNKKLEFYNEKLTETKGKLKKGVLLNEHKDVCAMEVVYKDKIQELEKQMEEFVTSKDSITNKLTKLMTEQETTLSKYDLKELIKLYQIEKVRCQTGLPIYSYKSEIVKTVTDNQVTILIGETGSGKTTQIAQYLYEAWPRSEKIIACTQPRKVAAVSVADRVAKEMNCTLGRVVGYQVGMNRNMSGSTRILFMTDHMLLNECLNDETFSKYSCIILDEAHERSIFTDLLLGFIKKILPSRKDLKLIITSATIDPFNFVNYFQEYTPNVLKVSGRLYPVEVKYEYSFNPRDHVISACHKAIEIHWREKLPGDILVFLTSPIETEQAVEFFKSRDPRNAQVLSLHGRLLVEEQREVLQPTKEGFRKIVFATNAAETSLTIPGIKYVIDTGLVREMTFDGSKNMSSLVLTKITKSSADQRKGRAGRTESGICYRLFREQEYNEMKPTSVPEILRVHLGQSLLKLMMLGVENPREFDFVEAPPVETIDLALKLLKDLGAVDDYGITDLGEQLAKISLEPRLAKVVLMGVEENLGYECVVLSALSSIGSQIFYRGGTNENKSHSDKRKSTFCDDYGDMITLLNVYKDWFKTSFFERSNWCFQNFINAKKINGTRETIREMCHTLNSELQISINEIFSDAIDVNVKISKIIFKCFYYNLARYTGHRKIGFRLVGNPELTLQIHPSSSLNYMEQYPNWIVFDSILTTSQSFMINTTFVRQSWVDEMIESDALHYTQAQLGKIVLDSVKLDNVGIYLYDLLSTVEFKPATTSVGLNNINMVEKYINIKNPNALAIVDFDTKPFVFLYASLCEFQNVLEMVNDELYYHRLNLFNDTLVVSVKPSSNVKVILTNGGYIDAFLMPNERSQLVIKFIEDPTHSAITLMETAIEKRKGVNRVYWNRDENECLVTFSDPKFCSDFLEANPESVHKNFTHFSPVVNNDNLLDISNISVKVIMIRRPAKGYGFIYFKSDEKCKSFLTSNSILTFIHNGEEEEIIATLNKKSNEQAYLRNLPIWATSNHISSALKDVGVVDDDVVKVVIPRDPPPTPAQNAIQIEAFRDRLTKLCKGIEEKDINIIRPHNDKDFNLIAYIKCNNSSKAKTVIRDINLFEDDVYYMEAEFEIKCTYFTPQKFYDKSKVDGELLELKNEHGESLTIVNKLPNNLKQNIKTVVMAQTLQCLFEAKERLDPLLAGVTWVVPLYRIFHSKKYETFKKELEVKNSVFISFEEHKKCIVIYGSHENVKQTKKDIGEHLKNQTNDITKEIDLRDPQYARGLMKCLIRQFGYELMDLINETGANDLDINLKKHQLVFLGSHGAYEKLESVLKEVSTAIETSRVNNGQENVNNDYFNIHREGEELGECPICLDSVSFNDYYVIEYCGHIYCKDCITNLIKNNCQQSNFPMKCIKENCNEELVLKDFQNLLTTKDEFQILVESSVKYFQSQNSDKFVYCPTPDCSTIFKKLPESEIFLEMEEFICTECQRSICTSCGGNFHSGMSCSTFNRHFNSADDTLKKWLKADLKFRSICPKCGYGIEKNGGCNHVECINCKIHICWVCKQRFNTSTTCYDHMRRIHNRIQDDEDDDDEDDDE